jgi:putative redox protein
MERGLMVTGTSSVTIPRNGAGPPLMEGQDVQVGLLAPDGAEQPAWRVGLKVGVSPGHGDGGCAGLTPAQARQLGTALIGQAAAAEEQAGTGGISEGPADRIEVAHAGGESYAITTRGHVTLADQPAGAGGADAAPTPTELLVAALASCVAFYTGRYLMRHGLERDGLRVSAEFTMAADRPARVGAVRLLVRVPAGLPAERRAALVAVASHCTVHNTLRQPPGVTIDLA